MSERFGMHDDVIVERLERTLREGERFSGILILRLIMTACLPDKLDMSLER